MRLSDFKFKLPEELIAQFPSRFRDDARLLVLHTKTGLVEHKMMTDFASYFDEEDLVIANDTKVFPARLYAQKEKTLANIEVFLFFDNVSYTAEPISRSVFPGISDIARCSPQVSGFWHPRLKTPGTNTKNNVAAGFF